MNLPTPSSSTASTAETPALGGCLLRVFWLLVGNAILLLVAVMLLLESPWTIGLKDGLFWATAVAVVAARWVDVTHYGGRTAEGGEATLGHVGKHALTIGAGAAAIWVVAQSVQLLAPSGS